MSIDVIGCENDQQVRLMQKVAGAVMQTVGSCGSIGILIADEAGIQALNAQFRKVDAVTDVLSFATQEEQTLGAKGRLGDIAICMQRAAQQAQDYGHSVDRELAFLTAHGCLHLLGYDHTTPTQEGEMFALQEKILAALGYSRPK